MTILFKRHFQVAYLVDDIHAATVDFGTRYGIANWHVMDMAQVHGDASSSRFIALAWTDEDLMIELIEPNEQVPSIYSDWRNGPGRDARFHHLGFLIESDEEFSAAKRTLSDAGCPVATEGSFGEILEYAYIDTTAALGHFFELVYFKGDGMAQFFGPVPHN